MLNYRALFLQEANNLRLRISGSKRSTRRTNEGGNEK
jgi:hypothetical protein